MTLRLPEYPTRPPRPAAVRTPRDTLVRTAPRQRREITVAGAGAALPVAYGITRCDALLIDYGSLGGDLVMVLAWCLGPIASIDAIVTRDGDLAPAAIQWTHYLGDSAQTVDATAAAAISGWEWPMVATSDLASAPPAAAAYSVARIPAGTDTDLQFRAQVHGMLIHRPLQDGSGFDPVAAWSDNPAECLADFISSPLYGRGASVSAASARAAALACAETLGNGPRRRIGLTLARRQPVDAWIDTLRAYAGCYVDDHDADTHLIPDRPGESVREINDSHIVAGTDGAPRLDLRVDSVRGAPTVVRVDYTDTSKPSWPTGHAYAASLSLSDTWLGRLPGDIAVFADVGETSGLWVESVVPMPGIQCASQALREAVERLSALRLTRLRLSMITTDASLVTTAGDIVTVSSARLPDAVTARVMTVDVVEPGRWRIDALEYDHRIYSNITRDDPGPPSSPAVAEPGSAPTGLHVSSPETYLFYDVAGSRYRARVRFSVGWDLVESHRYRVELITDQRSVTIVSTRQSPTVVDGWLDRINLSGDVRIEVTDITSGSPSPAASIAVTSLDAALTPPDVSGLVGSSSPGRISLSWDPVIHPDLEGYEVRRGAPGDRWRDAISVGVLSATILDIAQPAGTHEYQVRGAAKGGNLSSHAATVTLSVALAPGGGLSDSHAFRFGSSSGMHQWRAAGVDHWVSDLNSAWGDLFPAAMSGYTNPVASYHAAGDAEWLSDVWDIGQRVAARWTVDHTIAALSGSVAVTVQLSDDAITWADVDADGAGAGRYVRIRAATSGTDTMHVVTTGLRVHVSAVVVEESSVGTVTSSATGPTIITLAHRYVSVVGFPDITPVGATPLTYSVDAIVTGLSVDNTFEVRLWDSSGVQVAADFGWHWTGVT